MAEFFEPSFQNRMSTLYVSANYMYIQNVVLVLSLVILTTQTIIINKKQDKSALTCSQTYLLCGRCYLACHPLSRSNDHSQVCSHTEEPPGAIWDSVSSLRTLWHGVNMSAPCVMCTQGIFIWANFLIGRRRWWWCDIWTTRLPGKGHCSRPLQLIKLGNLSNQTLWSYVVRGLMPLVGSPKANRS